MVKHPQRIRWLLPTNCLSVFDHFVRLALKRLSSLFWYSELSYFHNLASAMSFTFLYFVFLRFIHVEAAIQHTEVFSRKGVLKICSKFTGEHPFRSAISIKLLCSFIETALRHGCSPENLLHVFRTPFLEKISEGLLLYFIYKNFWRLHFS